MTHTVDLYTVIWQGVRVPLVIIASCAAIWLWIRIGQLVDERTRERHAVRLINPAELDDWEAAILADPLPEDTEPILVEPTEAQREPRHYAVEVWQPRTTPLEHYEPATASLARIPGYIPATFHPQTYASRAAEWQHDMRDGVEVYDEDAYAAGVIRRLHSSIDAPVSPAFGYEHRPRHALGAAEGTETQRRLWEQDTGAWPVVRELVSA